MAVSPESLRGLHERAARALPAELVEDAGGWWLRHARGGAWWVRSALPHGGAAPDELARGIAAAEAFYAGHGVAARFQISPPACADALDAILAGRGYRRHDAMSLQGAPTARVLELARPGPLRVRLDDRPADAWFEVWAAASGHGDDARHERDMLARVERPSAYAGAMLGDEVVAVGRAVADTGWAGLFGMATLPRARGRGAARAVLAALAGFAQAQGADRMYLQVERRNDAALALYGRTGFGEICGYHYRTAG
ncbi:GNAT family N-acetyltransferase [Actinomadura litoris]|uniref:GNAT family N-acetyltransferase n=1 Tax=Actinomadura litoris TaxID=2678616 RepID=UPI001FA7F256|nr:GNAT family N-acetyltransferase [Actinomadura litoris]